MTKFQTQFRTSRRAGTPIVVIRSADAVSSVQSVLVALNGKQDAIPLMQWDIMRGLQGINELGKSVAAEVLNGQAAEMVSARPTDCLGLAQNLPADVILFAHNLQLFWQDGPVIQAVLNLRDRFKGNGSMLVSLAVSGSTLPAELTEHSLVLDEALPTAEELAVIVAETFKAAELPEPKEEETSKAVDAVTGLSAFAAESSLSLSISREGFDVAECWNRKRKMIEQTPGLQVWSGKETFSDLGGLDQFKKYVSAVFNGNDAPKCAVFMDEIEKAVAQDSGNSTKTELIGILLSWFADREADGLLMLGVPGAGKSQAVKAIANEFSVPVISANVAAMQDQFVGNSNKNLRKALATIDAMSNGKPCVFATCNRLDSLSPELRRRFTLGTFFFDLPTKEERSAIWDIYLAKYGPTRGPMPSDDGWTGAEIKECCRKAYRLNITLAESAKYIVPVSKSSAETIKALRLQASGKFLSATDAGVYRYEEQAVATGRKFRE
jgi:hypothetical protein